MSLTKIVFVSMVLGVIVGLLGAALAPAFGLAANPLTLGCLTAFASVIVAGLRQAPPRR